MRRNKFNNKKTEVDGFMFDSKAEAKRYTELALLLKARKITNLCLQTPFDLEVNGVHICTYRADFTYTDKATGREVVEDVKGFKTDIYRLKRKLMKACHGITIEEIGAKWPRIEQRPTK